MQWIINLTVPALDSSTNRTQDISDHPGTKPLQLRGKPTKILHFLYNFNWRIPRPMNLDQDPPRPSHPSFLMSFDYTAFSNKLRPSSNISSNFDPSNNFCNFELAASQLRPWCSFNSFDIVASQLRSRGRFTASILQLHNFDLVAS